jgi:hypothetical protein
VPSNNELLKQVVLSAFKMEYNERGWVKVTAPGASDREVCLAIMEAAQRGLVKAVEVSSNDSPYPEWRLQGPTAAGRDFLDSTEPPALVSPVAAIPRKHEVHPPKSILRRGITWAVVTVIVAIMGIIVEIYGPEIRHALGLSSATDSTQHSVSGPVGTTGSQSPAVTGNGNTVIIYGGQKEKSK